MSENLFIAEQGQPPAVSRFLYGVNCTWLGTFADAAENGSRCPFCKGMVGMWSTEAAFWRMVDAFESGVYEVDYGEPSARPHPGYRKMWEWAREEMNRRKQCYKNIPHMRNSFAKHTGTEVDILR